MGAEVRSAGRCAKSVREAIADGPLSKLYQVQVLRGVAALSIAALHAQHDAAALALRYGLAFAPADRFPWAAGVDMFFVISGFIMVHASRSLFGAGGSKRIFLSRRIARIVPLYWTVTTLYLCVALAVPTMLNSAVLEPWPVVASYLFIPFERPDGAAQPLYSLGWTLNYEMFFYALFALFLVFSRSRAVLGLMALLAVLVCLGLAFRLPQPLRFWTDPIMLEFAFGLGLGLVHAEGARLGGPARLGFAALAIGLLALDLTRPDGAIALTRALAWGLPATLLVAAAALGREGSAPVSALTRAGAAVGDASYALYLIHPFAVRAGHEVAIRTGLGPIIGPWGYVAAVLILSVLASVAVYRGFERPATRQARRWLEPVRPPRLSSP
jgi:peptidoglycan/LPS O-acetylase OafA/YrhL